MARYSFSQSPAPPRAERVFGLGRRHSPAAWSARVAGNAIDQALFGAHRERALEGPRLADLDGHGLDRRRADPARSMAARGWPGR